MCRKQCSRRNINELTFAKLIQEEYDATCKSVGAQSENKNAKKQSDGFRQIEKSKAPTRDAIAKEHNISPYVEDWTPLKKFPPVSSGLFFPAK